MNQLTRSGLMAFSTGYSDCATCGGAGGTFIQNDIYVSCPECDQRDKDFEEVTGLDHDGYFGSPV